MSKGKTSSTTSDLDTLRDPWGTFLVFETTHLTMKAESLFKEAGLPHRLFPKPRNIISECGLVIKVMEADMKRAANICERGGVTLKDLITVVREKRDEKE